MSKRVLYSLLLMVCSSLHAAISSSESIPPVAPYFGLHIHRADNGTKWPTPAFGSWRLWDAYVAWPNLEPERGRWDFARLDRYVAMAKLTGVDVLLPLGLSPTWASARPNERASYALGNAAEPRDIDDWKNYVRTVATRYKGRIQNFEIWNEPNERSFFSGTPEKLVELTCEARRVLKSVSPENRLVSPSMVGLGNAPELLGAFLEKVGRNCIDIVGFHFYVPKGPPEALLPLVARVRAATQKAGVGQLPLWNTESGWWIANEGTPLAKPDPEWLRRISVAQSGAWVARSLILGRSAGLERFYWYAWDNKEMGLIEPKDGSYRPGADAYAAVATWLKGSTTVNCAADQANWTCIVDDPADKQKTSEVLLVWNTSQTGAKYQVPVGKRVLSIDSLDGEQAPPASFGNLKTIQLTEMPIRLTLSK